MENQSNNSEEMEKTIDNLKTDAVKGEEIKGGGFIMATDAVTDGFVPSVQIPGIQGDSVFNNPAISSASDDGTGINLSYDGNTPQVHPTGSGNI